MGWNNHKLPWDGSKKCPVDQSIYAQGKYKDIKQFSVNLSFTVDDDVAFYVGDCITALMAIEVSFFCG